MASSMAVGVIVGLASFSSAFPMSSPVHSVFRRQESSDLCTNADLSRPEGAAAKWNDFGVGARLDQYIGDQGAANWVNTLASESFPGSGDPGSFGCGSRDQPCMSGLDLDTCGVMAADDRGTDFWILNAVQKMHAAFERAHENLQDSIIDSSLSVSGIASDFKIDFASDDKILRYVAAAFGMAGGMIGYGSGPIVNALKTSATMFGAAFATTGVNQQPAIDPSKAMDSALKEVFESQRRMLDGILKLAVGGGGDYDSLPDQSGDYSTSVARFMADGKFLLQGDLVNQYFSKGYEMLNKKLVDIALQQFGYQVLADKNYEDAESCGANYGAHWLDLDGGRCMRLTYEDNWTGKWLPAPEEVVKAVEENYGMDIFGYFGNLCDCHINGNGEVDLGNLATDGNIPQCFYNLACQDADICCERISLSYLFYGLTSAAVDEEGDHDWYICWPDADFNDSPAPAPTEPEGPETEPTEPAFPSDRDDTGCYSGGLSWSDLHGDGSETDTQEVKNDISTRCQAADGTILGLNDFWWDCTEWGIEGGGVNHIWWEIQTEGDSTDEVTITYDTCNSALSTELGGCSTGSEQNHDGLWFKIDPQAGSCPYQKG
ncbi:uncharacterized protein LTR77_004012 [Saxophila tyrrhenica]|uniref:Uncharacterized protein n=1 Tax=Saxophila tyrrhenica TaxID=1690608 RepID=A0AAV9PF67_9PEZI|nr:hypothetical protein LTR77_004012 [Saxophila tyrrhenica]